VHLVTVPPIVGAVLLALESLGSAEAALERARRGAVALFESGRAAHYEDGGRRLAP
jgi:hypothetical protein